MKRCVVIGGNGFIGRSLLELLVTTGREVISVGRSEHSRAPLPPGTRHVKGDYGNHATLNEVLRPGCEVVDLAYSTVPKTSYGDPLFDLISNIPPSVGLLQAATRAGVSKVVLVSSGGTVYGHARSLPIREDHPTKPVSPYGITKLTIDHYAMMFHSTMDLPVSIARPANAYGETQRAGRGQGFLATAIDAIQSRRAFDIYGENGTTRDYIHVDDVAAGILAVLDKGASGEAYNIGTGQGTSHPEIIRMLEELAGTSSFEVQCRFLPGRRFDVPANILDSQKLFSASGWQHKVELWQGLRRMWEASLHHRKSGGKSEGSNENDH